MGRTLDQLTVERGPWLVAGSSLALLAGAFAFQHLGGLAPCVLCIWQRWPHAIAAVLALVAGLLTPAGRGGAAAAWLMVAAGVMLLAGAGIAGFHVGVEQHWWEGTAECGTTETAASVAELKARLLETPVARCDEVAWSLLGISMAGWNLLLSVGLAGLSFLIARKIYGKSKP